MRFIRRNLFCLLVLSSPGPAFAADVLPPAALATLDGATFASGVASSLEARNRAEAYFFARAWQRQSPSHFGATAALAQVYLHYDAPAAALESVARALRLAPGLAEARDLLAFKVRAHAELGDTLAAWANARETLRIEAPVDEDLASSLTALKWAAYAKLLSENAMQAFEARRDARDIPPRPLLTKERVAAGESELHEIYRRRLAEPSEDRDTLLREFARYLAINEHFGPWNDPGGVAPPLSLHPDLIEAFAPYAARPDLPVYARWVRDHLPETPASRSPRGATTPSAVADDSVRDLPQFLQTVEPRWARLRPQLEQGVARADAARSISEIEDAWNLLEQLMNGPMAELLREIDIMASRLDAGSGSAQAAAIERFARWRALSSDPLVAAARLRGVQVASGNAVVSEEEMAELKTQGRRMEHQMTETEAAPSLFRRWAHAVIAAEEADVAARQTALANNHAVRPADFDPLIANHLMTTGLWEIRLRAAGTSGGWSDQVWSAFHAFEDQPAALDAWLAPRMRENDALLAGAIARLEGDDNKARPQALDDLFRGLERDPAHVGARRALLRAFLHDGLDEAAHEQLVALWRLHLPSFRLDREAWALAVRRGDWPFLLEVGDERVLVDDTDIEAHFHRQLAAAALGLPELTADSTSALNGTPYHSRTRLLHWIARDFLGAPVVAFDHEITGIKGVIDLLGTEDEDPAARVWLALLLARHPQEFARTNVLSWRRLELDASPAVVTHLNFIRGQLGALDYHATHRDTDQAPIARFVELHLATVRSPGGETIARLASLAKEPGLPLLLRVAASSMAEHREETSPATLRASARHHVSPRTQDWRAVWEGLAPGQNAVVSTVPDLTSAPSDRPLRLEALPDLGLVLPASDLTLGPLWELRRLHVRHEGSPGSTPMWRVANGHVLLVAEAHLAGQRVNTHRNGAPDPRGNLWIEDVEWKDSLLAARCLWLDDVFLSNSPLHVSHRLDASEVHAPDFGLALAGVRTVRGNVHAHARFADSVVRVTRKEAVTIAPGSTLRFDDSILIDNQTTPEGGFDFSSGAISATASRLVCHRAIPASLPAGLTPMLFDRFNAVATVVSNAAELHRALSTAKAGERIHLRAGIYELNDTLRVPAGVSLYGAVDPANLRQNATTLRVGARSRVNPLLAVDGGISVIERLTFDVPDIGTHPTGAAIGDQLADRKAIVAHNGALVLLQAVSFPGWNRQVRPALLADRSRLIFTDRLAHQAAVANDGKLSLLDGVATGLSFEGQGHVHAPHRETGRLWVRGEGLHFHHRSPDRFPVLYGDGAAPARDLARRGRAREHLLSTLEAMAPALATDLAASRDTDKRAEWLTSQIGALEHLVRAARLPAADLAQAFARHINPALLRQKDDLPALVDRVYMDHLFLSSAFIAAHRDTLPEAERRRVGAYQRIRYASFSRGDRGVPLDRQTSLAFLRQYPPGHIHHARALEAAALGDTPARFQQKLAAEAEAARLAHANALRAAEEAKARAAYEARLQREAEAARKRQAELAEAEARAIRRSSRWAPSSSASSSSSWTPSRSSTYDPGPVRQLQDYSRALDIKLHNHGRDYGQGMRSY